VPPTAPVWYLCGTRRMGACVSSPEKVAPPSQEVSPGRVAPPSQEVSPRRTAPEPAKPRRTAPEPANSREGSPTSPHRSPHSRTTSETGCHTYLRICLRGGVASGNTCCSYTECLSVCQTIYTWAQKLVMRVGQPWTSVIAREIELAHPVPCCSDAV